MINKNDNDAADKVTEVINDGQEQETIRDISTYV